MGSKNQQKKGFSVFERGCGIILKFFAEFPVVQKIYYGLCWHSHWLVRWVLLRVFFIFCSPGGYERGGDEALLE
jgi:hypothetical protein